MPFLAEEKHALKLLRQTKQYGAKHLVSVFPDKQWSLGGLKKLIRKIDDTGTVNRRSVPCSCPPTARVADKIDEVDDLVLRQDNAPNTHISQRQIVVRQASHWRQLTESSRAICVRNVLKSSCARINISQQDSKKVSDNGHRCRKLLKRYPASMVNFCWFTDEIFTVAAPSYSQNDRLYAPLLFARKTSQLIVFSALGQHSANRSWCQLIDVGTWRNKPSLCWSPRKNMQ